MDHKGDIERTHTTNKKLSGGNDGEHEGERFKRARKLVETDKKDISEEDLTRKSREITILMFEFQFIVILVENEKGRLFTIGIEEF